ncbi:MAG: glycosyltransferase family 2 protein [Patescibacteria group bacterium]
MKEKPLISVILPVHNAATTLSQCIISLLKQSYKNIEIIAIDDSSSDKSYSILRKLKKKNKKIRLYKNVKRYGIAVTLNRAIKKAKGTYITFMDTSDFSSPLRLKKQLRFLSENPNMVAVGSQCNFINEKGKLIGKSNFPNENSLIYQNPLHGISMQFETVLINRGLLPKDVLRFNTNSNPFIYSDIFMKLMPYGKFTNLKEFLHHHRNDPRNYLLDVKKNILSLIKLWAKHKTLNDYNAPLRSFFSPLIKSV